MKTVSIHDAKTNLSKYISAAKNGEQIFIGSRGNPEVELVLARPVAKRKLGSLSHLSHTLPDLDKLDKSPEWQEVIDAMNNDPTYHA